MSLTLKQSLIHVATEQSKGINLQPNLSWAGLCHDHLKIWKAWAYTQQRHRRTYPAQLSMLKMTKNLKRRRRWLRCWSQFIISVMVSQLQGRDRADGRGNNWEKKRWQNSLQWKSENSSSVLVWSTCTKTHWNLPFLDFHKSNKDFTNPKVGFNYSAISAERSSPGMKCLGTEFFLN